MASRLVLQSLRDPNKKFAIVRLLATLPSITTGMAQNQLTQLPWVLPQIKDKERQRSLRETLEKLGCVFSEREVDEVAETHSERSGGGLNRDKAPLAQRPQRGPEQKEVIPVEQIEENILPLASNESIEGYIENQRATHRPLSPKSLQFAMEAPKSRVDKNQKYFLTLKKMTLALLVVILLAFFTVISIRQCSLSRFQLKPLNAKISPLENSNQVVRYNKSRAQLELVQLAQKAEQLFNSALQETNPVQKVPLLKKATEIQPYHTPSWLALMRSYQILKDQGKLTRTQELYNKHNVKVRAVLHSLAKQFGRVQEPIYMDSAQIKLVIDLEVEDSGSSDEGDNYPYLKQGGKIYKEIYNHHPTKDLSLELIHPAGGRASFYFPAQENGEKLDHLENYMNIEEP